MFFAAFRRRRAIQKYVRQLGPALEKRYGRRRHYSPEEVRRASAGMNTSSSDFCYAYCIYCSEPDFHEHHRQAGESCDYHAMRGEVADLCFEGDAAFEAIPQDASPASEETGGGFGQGSAASDAAPWSGFSFDLGGGDGDSGGGGDGRGDGGGGGD